VAGAEQPQLVLLAPGRALAQIKLVGMPGQAAVAARNQAKASRSGSVETGVTGTSAADGFVVAIGHFRGLGLRPGAGPAEASARQNLTVSRA